MAINVVKIGGSLSKNPETLQVLCQKLSRLASKQRIVVIPGGGKFADNVREADKQFSLTATTTHNMATLAMDQYGLLLADLTPNSQTEDNIETVKKAKSGIVTVFLPSKFIRLEEKLPKTWDVTSDSIAAYIAKKIEVKKLLLIKDVDGIFTDDPKQNTQSKLFEHITTKELLKMKTTCVDKYLPQLLETLKINCHIINGFYPDTIETALVNKQTNIGTIIST
ncbi:MAG: hypothetical protein LBB87_03555 [Nitrososphaerota archaeon]|nr:hypothetical protein [Nitrososphaerota archaeon]